MTPVTDPAILAQLNGPVPVTDPAILAQLNGPSGYTDNVSNDWQGRKGEAIDILKNEITGKTSLPAAALQLGSQGLGAVTDVPKEAAKSIYGSISPAITEPIDTAASKMGNMLANGAQSTADAIDNTAPGKAIGDMLYNNPEAVKTAGAIANLSTIEPALSMAKVGAKLAPATARAGFLESNSSDPMAQSAKSLTPTSAETRTMGSNTFAIADSKGGSLRPEVTNSWADKAASILPQTEEAQTVFGKESPVSKMVDRIQELRDKPLTLQGTMEIEKGLGDLVHENIDPKTGKVTAEGNQYLQLQHGLRDLWTNATEAQTLGGKQGFDAAKEARSLWATSARMNDIERIIAHAKLMPNPAISVRAGMRSLLDNPSRTRGWSPEEMAAVNSAAKTGLTDKLLKLTSSRLVTPMMGGFAGGGIGAGLGSAVAEGSNALLNKSQLSKAGKVLDVMANNPSVQKAIASPPVRPAPMPTKANMQNRELARKLMEEMQINKHLNRND